MSAQTETSQSGVLDIIKLLIAAAADGRRSVRVLLLRGDSLPLRVSDGARWAGAGIAIAMTSAQGKRCGTSFRARALKFARLSGRRSRRQRRQLLPCLCLRLIMACFSGCWTQVCSG